MKNFPNRSDSPFLNKEVNSVHCISLSVTGISTKAKQIFLSIIKRKSV